MSFGLLALKDQSTPDIGNHDNLGCPLVYLLSKTFILFDFPIFWFSLTFIFHLEHIWWRLFHIRVVCTQWDIYFFILLMGTSHYLKLACRLIICTRCWQHSLTKNSCWELKNYEACTIPTVKWVSEWLLLNTNSAIFQLYHGENKLIINGMMTRSALH